MEQELAKLKSKGVSTTEKTLDLKKLGFQGKALQTEVTLLLKELKIADWDDLFDNPEAVSITRLSGALTNCVFMVHGPSRADVKGSSPTTTLSKSMPGPHDTTLLQMQPRALILRVYGSGVDSFLKRGRELYWLRRLSEMRLGPRIVGAFLNGRFEEYFHSRTLDMNDLRDPFIYVDIAREMAKLHFRVRPGKSGFGAENQEMIDGAYPLHGYDSEMWTTLKQWYNLAVESEKELLAKDKEQLELINLQRIGNELREFKQWMTNQTVMSASSDCAVNLKDSSFGIGSSLVVFCHNDTQYGNILFLAPEANSNLPFIIDDQILSSSKKKFQRVLIVDYEYAGMNYRGFDIGNHFMEWCADYHSSTPHLMRWDRYPNKEQRREWLRSYLECWYDLCYSSLNLNSEQSELLLIQESSVNILQEEIPNSPPPPKLISGESPIGKPWSAISLPTREYLVDCLENEVLVYGMLSHIFWALWGIIQASKSEIDFNYLGYSLDRINRFREEKEANH